MNVREPVVSGRFYPSDESEIQTIIGQAICREKDKVNYTLASSNLIGAVCPHAGYMFSSYQAIHIFEILKSSDQKFDTFVIINPNHTGIGNDVAIDDHEAWRSPLGMTELDIDLKNCIDLKKGNIEQAREHSGEVMLPLLQYFIPYPFKILPVTLSRQTFSLAQELSEKIYRAALGLKRNIFILASSDFNHFDDADTGKSKDQLVLDKILDMDSPGVEKTVIRNHISVCGYGPIMALMEYSKLSNQNINIDILRRGHSGEIIPSNEVVDYISILFSHPNN